MPHLRHTVKKICKKEKRIEISILSKYGASDAIRTRECSVHSRECWASSPHSPDNELNNNYLLCFCKADFASFRIGNSLCLTRRPTKTFCIFS